MSERYVLAVDGGNSKTLAVAAGLDGTVRGIGRTGNTNHQGQGVEKALAGVRAAVEEARARAGLEGPAEGALFALAGADLPEDFALLDPALADLGLARRHRLVNDSIAGLWAGSDAANAMVLIWGTGTNAAGQNAAGKEIRLPALGWLSGDWGGGNELGQEAVALVARAHDGRGAHTALTAPVLAALGAADPNDMIARLYHRQTPPGAVMRLAPLVFAVAAAGDPPARSLVDRALAEMTVTVRAILGRLDLLDQPADVVLSGGIFKAPDLPITELRRRIAGIAPHARVVTLTVEPVLGALFGALDLLGLSHGEEVRRRAQVSYERLAAIESPGGVK